MQQVARVHLAVEFNLAIIAGNRRQISKLEIVLQNSEAIKNYRYLNLIFDLILLPC
jgi:hypothetical protein